MRLAGHCVTHDDEVANKLVLWQPTDGHANRGRQKVTYVDNLLQDTGLGNTSELQTVMMDRGCWKGCVFTRGVLKDDQDEILMMVELCSDNGIL